VGELTVVNKRMHQKRAHDAAIASAWRCLGQLWRPARLRRSDAPSGQARSGMLRLSWRS